MRQPRTEPKEFRIDPAFLPVVEAFAKNRDVTRGVMMSSYGYKVNGKIFAMFTKGRFVTKLPKNRVDELVSGGKGERFDPGHGRLMKVGRDRAGKRGLDRARERGVCICEAFVSGSSGSTHHRRG